MLTSRWYFLSLAFSIGVRIASPDYRIILGLLLTALTAFINSFRASYFFRTILTLRLLLILAIFPALIFKFCLTLTSMWLLLFFLVERRNQMAYPYMPLGLTTSGGATFGGAIWDLRSTVMQILSTTFYLGLWTSAIIWKRLPLSIHPSMFDVSWKL